MSDMSTLKRTVASFVEEAGETLEAAPDGALGKYRERFALGGDTRSGR